MCGLVSTNEEWGALDVASKILACLIFITKKAKINCSL